jgi:hypothetical protein
MFCAAGTDPRLFPAPRFHHSMVRRIDRRERFWFPCGET